MSCPNDEAHSVKDNVSKRGTVPKALSPHIQVAYLPVVRGHPHSQMHSNPYGSKMAVFVNIPCSYRRSWDHDLEVSIGHYSNTVSMKRSNLNIISVMKPIVLLASVANPGSCPNLPGLVSRESGHHGRSERVHERLRVYYTLRKIGERHTHRSPVGVERNLTVTRQVETCDKCHVSCDPNQTCSTCLSLDSQASPNCSSEIPIVEYLHMACMREYVHPRHPKIPTLDMNSDLDPEPEDDWNSDSEAEPEDGCDTNSDYYSPESEVFSGDECSDRKWSEGESEDYSSDMEDYSRGHHDQSDSESDYSSDDSENDEISNPNSDGCTTESDSLDPDLEEYSESESDDFYDLEEL